MKEHIQDILVGGRPMTKLELANKEIERLQDMDKILRNENINLKLRINKAIEYIEEQSKFIKGCDIYRICNKDTLLEILKGSDKECKKKN